MAFLTEIELKDLGLKKFGRNCKISTKASIYGAENIEIGDDCRIDDFSILSAGKGGIKIGNYVHIACQVSIIGQGEIIIGDFAGISGGCHIYSSSDSFTGDFLAGPTIPAEYTQVTSKPVIIGKFVTIGAGSIILPGVKIGENSAIGALTLLRNDHHIGPNLICVGNPLKVIKYRSKNTYILEEKLKNSGMRSNPDGGFTIN